MRKSSWIIIAFWVVMILRWAYCGTIFDFPNYAFAENYGICTTIFVILVALATLGGILFIKERKSVMKFKFRDHGAMP